MKLINEFDFNGGTKVPKFQLDKWRKEVVDSLKRHPKEKFSYILSGDGLVIGFRRSNEEITVFVTNGYIEYTYGEKK